MPRASIALPGPTDPSNAGKLNQVRLSPPRWLDIINICAVFRIAIDPIFLPPPIPNSKKHQIPDAMDNRYELVFNERDDAAELKNLPIDDTMHGIIEEEELEDEASDEEAEAD